MFLHPYAVDIGGSSNRQEPESEETSSTTGGIVTGNITLTSTPTDQNHLTTVRLAENASNLKTGTISKDLLPQTLNSFALNSGAIYLKNPNDSTGYFKEQVGRTNSDRPADCPSNREFGVPSIRSNGL